MPKESAACEFAVDFAAVFAALWALMYLRMPEFVLQCTGRTVCN